ncbi:hypothetical protein ANCCEY_14380 [Ancylostoma ceylanicum]|uniref:Uncharacterized protein n=1 Tax=Ancylostoma ceylanicum TaxID=53326 RepID=A0A0D6L9Y8_9BILA|nr:hypothetical protein ANCCEY_14380 [Ancylostoma ceylanicum]
MEQFLHLDNSLLDGTGPEHLKDLAAVVIEIVARLFVSKGMQGTPPMEDQQDRAAVCEVGPARHRQLSFFMVTVCKLFTLVTLIGMTVNEWQL